MSTGHLAHSKMQKLIRAYSSQVRYLTDNHKSSGLKFLMSPLPEERQSFQKISTWFLKSRKTQTQACQESRGLTTASFQNKPLTREEWAIRKRSQTQAKTSWEGKTLSSLSAKDLDCLSKIRRWNLGTPETNRTSLREIAQGPFLNSVVQTTDERETQRKESSSEATQSISNLKLTLSKKKCRSPRWGVKSKRNCTKTSSTRCPV